uniref:Uncharacterized protein n=1 Tax=Wuchereria bancrofti TaxID=6293 RepID=A0AAF5RT19_WUCBA
MKFSESLLLLQLKVIFNKSSQGHVSKSAEIQSKTPSLQNMAYMTRSRMESSPAALLLFVTYKSYAMDR